MIKGYRICKFTYACLTFVYIPFLFLSFSLVFISWTTELWCFVNNAEVWALPRCPIIHSTIGNFTWTDLFWFGGFILGVLIFFPRFIFHFLLPEKQTWMGLWLEVLFAKLLSKFYFIAWLLASCSTSSRCTSSIMHSSRSWRENCYLSMSCSLMPRRSKLQIQQSKRNII